MTKLLCPFCRGVKSSFGVPRTHQSHINKHIEKVHGIRVTKSDQAHWREEQDRTWNERHDKIFKELKEAQSRHRKRVREKVNKGEAPIGEDLQAGESMVACLQGLHAELMLVDSDGEEDAEELQREGRSTASILQSAEEERGKKYGVSCRHHQVTEGMARAVIRHEESLKVDTPMAQRAQMASVDNASGISAEVAEEGASFMLPVRRRERRQASRPMVDDPASRARGVGGGPPSSSEIDGTDEEG